MGHALEQEMSPTSSHTTILLAFSLFTYLPLLCRTRVPTFHLIPFQPSGPSLGGGLPLSSRGWNPMFTFSPVSAPTQYGL